MTKFESQKLFLCYYDDINQKQLFSNQKDFYYLLTSVTK